MKSRRNESKNTFQASYVPNLVLFYIGFPAHHPPSGNCPLFPRPAVMGSHSRLLMTPLATPCSLSSWPRIQVSVVPATMESMAS